MVHRSFVLTAFAVALSTSPALVEATEVGVDARPSSPDLWRGSPEIDVDSLVSEVLVRNPTLAAMRSAWQAATERRAQVTALEDPHLSYGLAPATIGEERFDLGQRFELSQRIPWPGKLATRGDVALGESEAAAEELDATRLGLVESAREAFYDWWYVHRAVAIHDATRDLLGELRRIAEVRYGAGLVSKQDALQAEVEEQHLVHRGVVLERVREVTLARLNALLDLPPKAPVPPPPSTLAPPRPVPPADRLESEAVERRPVLRAQRRRIEAREADVDLARLDYLPDLTITGSYNSLWQADERRPMVGVGIDLPIQIERRRAALEEARARLRQAQSELAEERARVVFEVSRAAEELREQEHVVRLYRTSIVPAAEESLAAARSGYESATNDFLTLIEAERALLTADLACEQGLAEYHKARSRLERAVGIPLEEVEASR